MEYRSLPAPWMERTVTSWRAKQRLVEPTGMSNVLRSLLNPQLERNTKTTDIKAAVPDHFSLQRLYLEDLNVLSWLPFYVIC